MGMTLTSWKSTLKRFFNSSAYLSNNLRRKLSSIVTAYPQPWAMLVKFLAVRSVVGREGTPYLHCLNEKSYNCFDLDQGLCIFNVTQRLRGEIDDCRAHRLPQFFHLLVVLV